MTDTEIRPALTPEIWTDPAMLRLLQRPEWPTRALDAFGLDWPGRTSNERCVILMGLANAALPDGDPRKITPQDADEVRDASDLAFNDGDDVSGQRLNAIATKLYALLPPHTPE